MYYIPKYFNQTEMFSEAVLQQNKQSNLSLWRLMDGRLLWTLDAIRERFCGPFKKPINGGMIMNDWAWGGDNQYRGYRDIYLDIVLPENAFSVTSQHCFGRGGDYQFGQVTSEDVISDIIQNPLIPAYQYITGLETGTSWVHNDTRCWDKAKEGILTFTR